MSDKDKEWHKIGYLLTTSLNICNCQRKLKSIVEVLNNILDKFENNNTGYTGEEYLILALLDANTKDLVCHGTNCEYPILIIGQENFWEWIRAVRNSEFLEDN